MKGKIAFFLAVMLFVSGTAACGGYNPEPVIPERKEPPGKLVGLSLVRGGGMVAGYDFEIVLNCEEIEYARFYSLRSEDNTMTEIYNSPIDGEQWADIERLILSMYQDLEECVPTNSQAPAMDAFMLDGGEYHYLSLTWDWDVKTAEKSYVWPSDRRVLTLTALLEELAEPCGREIEWFEEPLIQGIYVAAEHPLNHKKDFSYQIRRVDYYTDTQPYWELVYYLGKDGKLGSGSLPLEGSDWENFLQLAQASNLEFFPAPEKNERFNCTLYYSDGLSKRLNLNEETEKLLKEFFEELLQP